jgi:hypothetical protein
MWLLKLWELGDASADHPKQDWAFLFEGDALCKTILRS